MFPVLFVSCALFAGGYCAKIARSGDDSYTSSSNVIELDALDPQNHGFSSYSVVETARRPIIPVQNVPQPYRGTAARQQVANSVPKIDPNVAQRQTPGRTGNVRSSVEARNKNRASGGDEEPPSRQSEKPFTIDASFSPWSLKHEESKSVDGATTESSFAADDLDERQPSGSHKKARLSDDLKKSGSYLNDDLRVGFEEGVGKEKHFDKEGGKKYAEAHKAEKGEKAHQGYQKEEGYEKDKEEKVGQNEKKAVLSEKEGEKKGYAAQDKRYGDEYKGNEGEKGVSIVKKGGNKKGTKKKGFHKVHHKDEYKKDETFYDESHDGDEREEHAQEHEKHAKEKGGSAKKSSVDSGYHEDHGEKKGVSSKGNKFEETSGHKKQEQEEAKQDKHSEYDKKGGVKEGKVYGHADKGSSGGGYFDDDVI